MPKIARMESTVKVKDGRRIVIYYNNRHYSTGKIIHKKSDFKSGYLTAHWNGDFTKANKEIYDFKRTLDNLIAEARAKGLNGNDYIQANLKKASRELSEKVILANASISDMFKLYIDDKTDKSRSKSTRPMDRYNQELSRIKEFESERYKILAVEVNYKWMVDFTTFLAEERTKKVHVKDKYRSYTVRKKYGNSNSTINRFIIDFKTFMIWMDVTYGTKFPKDLADFEEFEMKTVEDNIITFSEVQWEAFKKYEPQSVAEQKAYDAFTFCCYTGLRYSDFSTLFYEDVTGVKIKKMAQKTGRLFQVPMNSVALKIFEKYNRDFRQKFANNQQINYILREILKKMREFHEEVKIIENVLTEKKVVKKKAYEVMSFHVSRKNFTTFLISSGKFSMQEVQAFTGWSNDARMFTHYLNKFHKRTEEREEEVRMKIDY